MRVLSYYILSKGLYSLSSWILIVLLARNGGASEVGIYGLLIAFLSPLYMLSKLGLRGVVATNPSITRDKLREFSSSRNLLGLISSLVSLIILLTIGRIEYITVIALIFLSGSKLSELNIEILYGYLQRINRLKPIMLSMTVRSLMSLLLFYIIYYLIDSALLSVVISIFISNVLSQIYLNRYYNYFKGERSYKFQLIYKNIRHYFPLGLSFFFASIFIQMPRYSVSNLSDEIIGIIVAFSYFIFFGNLFSVSVAHVYSQWIKEKLRTNDLLSLMKIFMYLSIVSLVLVCVIILIPDSLYDNIISLIFGDDFTGYNFILRIYLISAALGLNYNFLQQIRVGAGEVNLMMISQIIGIGFFGTSIVIVNSSSANTIMALWLTSYIIIIISSIIFAYFNIKNNIIING